MPSKRPDPNWPVGVSKTLSATQRRERARNAGRAAHSIDAHIDALVRTFPPLTAEQKERILAIINSADDSSMM